MTADVVDTTAVLAGIRADDALLDALGGRDVDQPESLVDDELNALLLAWRRDVETEPASPLVSTRRAVWLFRRACWTRRLASILLNRRSTQ